MKHLRTNLSKERKFATRDLMKYQIAFSKATEKAKLKR